MLEETLRAEAQVLHDMLSTHDTDDFMQRLFARIDQTPTRPQRVQIGPADPSPHRSTRPAIRRGIRRRSAPFTGSDPADRPAASLDHVRRLCETVLLADGITTLMAAFDHDYDAAGACAFACLLYILGRRGSALYWWRFAAGADDPLSAHVLALYYAGAGPLPAARVWCAYSRFLGYTADRHLPGRLRLSAVPPNWQPSHTGPVSLDLVKHFVAEKHLPRALAQH
ncbi:hypothetical protein PZB75_30145 [Streptomyces sp. AM 4-1-1]|uniref:hypothetical protein n=1 Tax=Streptomyces sp. AM 4-1-1 TaxID=3028710 RepID=UPI0023BA38BF|nr:hypothetical protein [Streptomyces sp. AM 4-1-1]WEH37252.1 hypothetical protein PZB75_30145 [Streptomyces sp. AM 4-1-1]